jgi:hypothetical protein|nr:hypothetical protein [uncultured Flavobacterium sp.]
MDYTKHKYLLIVLFSILFSCSKSDDSDTSPLTISVSKFEASYNQVKINWELSRPAGVIIQELSIQRQTKNSETEFARVEKIANLPSNETTFVDNEVPYNSEVSYKIVIVYTDERISPAKPAILESENKIFSRDIVKFDGVPFQVLKDPNQTDVFHILDKQGTGFLKRYNSTQNKLTGTKAFKDGSLLNNKFQIVNNNEIFLADTKGTIYRINANNYQAIATYPCTIINRLNAFSVLGNLIYYQDKDTWCYYDMNTGTNINTGWGSNADYLEPYNSTKLFSLHCYNGNNGLNIFEFISGTCTSSSCFSISYNHSNTLYKANSIDANIFAWNTSKTKIISSINGCVFNINDFKIEKTLYDITKKRYFQFVFDDQDNLYATVQGEKIIHKFNSNYELIEVIKTKLYPLFPMVTSNGLKVIGGYQPVSYWGFEYGYSFNFNIKCAIETF